MDGSKKFVAKWTRFQCQKAEEELTKIAKMLKNRKNRRTNGSFSEKSKSFNNEACNGSGDDVVILSGSSGGNSVEEEEEAISSSSDSIEIVDEVYIPHSKRKRHSPKSRISKLRRGISIDETIEVAPCPESKDSKKKSQRTGDKNIVTRSLSRSNSLSSSREDRFSSIIKGNDNGEGSGDHQDNEVEESCNQGSESDQSDSAEGTENQNQEKIKEIDDSSSEFSSDSSSEEKDDNESDVDYNVDESSNSGSDSETESDFESDHSAATVKRSPTGENREAGKADLQKKKEHPAGSLDMGDDCGNRNDDDEEEEVRRKRKSQQTLREKLTKLDSVKLSSNSTDGNELDGAARSSRRRDVKQSTNMKHPSLRGEDLMNILSDSIWEERDALKEKLPPLKETVASNLYSLPLKFKFEDDDDGDDYLSPDEEEKEIQSLFAALEMGLIQGDIGSTKLSKESNDNDNDNSEDDKNAKSRNPAERCQLGHHFLILDEQIGVICKYCGIVQQEMKYILPDLKIQSRRRNEWYAFHNDKSSHSDEFQFGHSATGDHHAIINDMEGSVLNIIPAELRRRMYPHQLDGFEFLWKNIAGATMVEDLKTSLPKGGTGCIISHAPGTGKSFLTIVFLLTFMEVHPTCRPVIIAPLAMLRAWGNELKRWNISVPFHNLNDADLSGEENVIAASIIIHHQQVESSRNYEKKKRDLEFKRMVKLYSWTKDKKCILGIGYNLFEKLTGEHRKGTNGNNSIADKFRKILLELPGVLILDEGHTPRNHKSQLWKALTKVETGRRIILSGTPFQNNFDELYNTFCLVNPKFVERISVETCKSDTKSKRDLAKGRWDSLTSLIDKNGVDAVEKLRAMMDPFVHVHKGNLLHENLPGLRDTLILLNSTEIQKQLLPKIPDNNIFERAYLASLVSVHPFLVSQHEGFSDQRSMLEQLEMHPEAGVKTQFVIEMVRLSNARDEKVLIFSEFIDPLNFLMKNLTSYFSWEEGKEVLYMDGKLEDKQRQSVINSFNARNSEAKVLLASTKACSEGISLVGASRVVLLDVVWNPSVERQAISRAYRLGQKKFVYIYRLVMSGTVEIEKFQRQAKKDRISELVFCSPFDHNNSEKDHIKSKLAKNMSGDEVLDAIVHHKNLSHIFEEIFPQAKLSNISSPKL